MALNLGAMISAARSQRNPAGEAIINYQNQNMIHNILKNAGLTGDANATEPVAEGSPVDNGMSVPVPQQKPNAVQNAGLLEIIKRGLV